MQTIKNILNPGGKESDELLYGRKDNLEGETFNAGKNTTSSGPDTGAVGTEKSSAMNTNNLTASGSDDTTTSTENVSQRDDTTTNTGPHSSNLANRVDPRVDTHQDTTRLAQGNTAAQSPPASASTNPYSGKNVDPRLGGSHSQATSFPTSSTGQMASGYSNPTNIEGPTRAPKENIDHLSNPTNTGNTSGSGNHLERDAAALGTGAAVGEKGLDPSTTRDDAGNTSANYGATTTSPNSGDRNTTRSGLTGTSTEAGHEHDHSHSHGTETAAGSAAAAALAGSRHDPSSQFSGTTPSGMPSSYHGGPKGTAVGPHDTMTANKLDPNTSDNKNMLPIENASTHHPETGGGAESADLAHSDESKLTDSQKAIGKEEHLAGAGSTGKDRHYGRDAGLAGVTVAGAGYEAENHYGKSSNDRGMTGTSHTATGTSSTSPKSTEKDHHHGRDAALGAGAGVAGYKATEHHDNKHDTKSTSGASPTTSSKDHKYGHDKAALWMGASGHESNKHVKSHESEASSADLGRHLHSSKILNVLDPRVKTTGIGATKEAKEAEAMRTKSNESGSGQGSHFARDGDGVSEIGGAGYQAEKHHAKHESPISDSTATSGMDRHHGATSTSHTGKDHHVAQDAGSAGLVGGAGLGGAVALGERGTDDDHERSRLHKDPPASHPSSGIGGAGTGYGPSGYGKTSSGTPYDSTEGGNYSASTGASSYGDLKAMPRSELDEMEGATGSGRLVGQDARREMVEQGERNLDGKTGVSNAGEGISRNL